VLFNYHGAIYSHNEPTTTHIMLGGAGLVAPLSGARLVPYCRTGFNGGDGGGGGVGGG